MGIFWERSRVLILKAIDEVGKAILGKEHEIRMATACLMAQGSLLIEDLPGMGKTSLSKALSRVFGLSYQRIQFTSDLLPADIIGVSIFDKNSADFVFKSGPIFSQLILADEINRASPKTQSALLEAMEEKQVTVDGVTRRLPELFFVIATQNPSSQMGTFPLPESQLDRFLMRIHLGYPSAEAEKALLMGKADSVADVKAIVNHEELAKLQHQVTQVHLSEPLVDYILRLVHATRQRGHFVCGMSPRGSSALARSAKAWAMIDGRDFVLPEDVQAILPAVLDHRVYVNSAQYGDKGEAASKILLSRISVG
ncbi:MAG: MoxR family ATPase [Gammaproteobacteria bacterium]|nr:MoxR family ATPase [Gammaproteobacteria bacterium]